MALKVFHTGDLHLGMLYRSRGYPEEVRQELVEARFRTLEQMVERANREECQLFLVAGDLFERLRIKEEQILWAARALARFSGICAVLPGNHDYYSDGSSLWERFCEYSADNLLLLSETRPYSLQEYGLETVLYPAPCRSKHSAVSAINWISDLPGKPEARWHLGVAHGSVEGYAPDFERNYFPMSEEELTSTGLDFWFLGHTHIRIPARDTFAGNAFAFAYCGTPEPDGFDCRHEGSAWVIQFQEQGSVEGEAIATGNYLFRDLVGRVSSGEGIEDLARRLAPEGERTLARLKLEGTLPREDFESRHHWREKLKKQLFYLEWDDTRLQMEISRDVIADLYPKGSFPYLLLKRLAEKGERGALQTAYQLLKEAED